MPASNLDRSFHSQPQVANPSTNFDSTPAQPAEPILCPHCLRTATNGIKCKGICVADSDY